MKAHVGLGLQDGRHFIDDLQHGVCQVIGHVPAARSHTRKRNELAVTRGDALVADADHGVVNRVGVNPEAFQYLLAELPIHAVFQ